MVAVGLAPSQMMFFAGMHQPCDAHHVPAAFVSIHRLRSRLSSFPVRRCIVDSGAFQTLALHGNYPHSAAAYGAELRRWKRMLGNKLIAAVSQDYMCEPYMLEKTGLTVTDHQRLTIERYDALVASAPGCRIMPVLQGYQPSEYVEHIRMYGSRLVPRHWVGVGSVCKRNARPEAVEDVLLAIKRARPDLRLHGFGVKLTALGSQLVQDLLFSADSMAWSWAARWQGRDANDPREAVRYQRRIATMPVQQHLFGTLWTHNTSSVLPPVVRTIQLREHVSHL